MYLISTQTDVRARLWLHRSIYHMTTHAFLLSLITTAFHSSYWPRDNDWRSITRWWYPKGWLQVLNLRFITWMFLSILLFMGWCALRFNRYKSQVIDTSTVQISSTFFVLDFKGILSWSLNLPFLMYIITVGISGFTVYLLTHRRIINYFVEIKIAALNSKKNKLENICWLLTNTRFTCPVQSDCYGCV